MNPFGNDSYRNNDDSGAGGNPFGDEMTVDNISNVEDALDDAHDFNASTDSMEPAGIPIGRSSFDGGRGGGSAAADGGSSAPHSAKFSSRRAVSKSASLPRSSSLPRDFYKGTVGTPSLSEFDQMDPAELSTASDALLQGDAQLIQELGLHWEDNEKATHCWCCEKTFSLMRRKHHCRMCGHVVCWDCSSQKMVVPGFEKKQRVCSKCSSTWIEKLVIARRSVQQLKVELEQSELKVGELSYQKSRLQAKLSETSETVEQLRKEVAAHVSVTEELHQQLEAKTVQIMKLKKQASSGSKKDKKSKRSAKANEEPASPVLDPNWRPPSLDGDSAAAAYGFSHDGEKADVPRRVEKVDESCKCVIS